MCGWYAFEPVLTRAEQMDVNDIWRIAAAIPCEWYEGDRDGQDQLVETLDERRGKIRDLITSLLPLLLHSANRLGLHFHTGLRTDRHQRVGILAESLTRGIGEGLPATHPELVPSMCNVQHKL